MTITTPIGLPWNFPLIGEINRSIFAPPRYRLRRRALTPAPGVAALTLDEVVLHLRLAPDATTGPEAPLLESMVAAATRHLEDYAGVTVVRTGWRMTMRRWPAVFNEPLDLPMPPFFALDAITIDGNPEDLTQYGVEIDERLPARLYPRSGYWRWVYHPFRFETIAIDYQAGGTADEVAPPIRQALLMAVAHWYENRESSQQFQLYPVVELGWEALLSPYREAGFA